MEEDEPLLSTKDAASVKLSSGFLNSALLAVRPEGFPSEERLSHLPMAVCTGAPPDTPARRGSTLPGPDAGKTRGDRAVPGCWVASPRQPGGAGLCPAPYSPARGPQGRVAGQEQEESSVLTTEDARAQQSVWAAQPG